MLLGTVKVTTNCVFPISVTIETNKIEHSNLLRYNKVSY